MKSRLRILSFASDSQADPRTMKLKEWEVALPNQSQAATILAYTKAQAIQTAIELFPGINPTAVTLWERPDWS
jgi:hypothetical protein